MMRQTVGQKQKQIHYLQLITIIFFRHAYETGCGDCFDYSNSVGYALPYLQSSNSESCKIHKVVLLKTFTLIPNYLLIL